MKLHRLELSNFRGIAHRVIEFPDRGVVVVSGPNEIGKSSMIEALDLLFEAKARSKSKEVLRVKPTHADEGAEVTALVSTGPYRFQLHKRFHVRPVTELDVFEPRREQLTGDEAHERAQAMLAETVDTALWKAQRVLQSQAVDVVDLSGSDALARALDVAAGQTAAQAEALSGTEAPLVDRVDAEFRSYFTSTGKPTGAWAAAIAELRATAALVTDAEAAVAEVDDAVARHAELSGEAAALAERADAARRRRADAEAAGRDVDKLAERTEAAATAVDSAESARASSAAALAERARRAAQIQERADAIAVLRPEVRSGSERERAAAAAATAATAELDEAERAAEDARAALDAATAAVADGERRDALRAQALVLGARMDAVLAAEREMAVHGAELVGIAGTAESFAAVESAARAVELAAVRAEAVGTRLQVLAEADVAIRIDGRDVALRPGNDLDLPVAAVTDVAVPGLLTVRLVPGASAADAASALDAAEQKLAAALTAAGVADVASARAAAARRQDLTAALAEARSRRDALLGGDSVGGLRERLDEVRAGADSGDAHAGQGLERARAERIAAVAAHRGAADRRLTCRAAAEAARTENLAASRADIAGRERLHLLDAEAARAVAELDAQRAVIADAELGRRAEADAATAATRAEEHAALAAALAAARPEDVAAERAAAAADDDQLSARRAEVDGELRDLRTRLDVWGAQGRQGRLDDARARHRFAADEHDRIAGLAGSARLLRDVLFEHRDRARARYVDPFRTAVETLGRIVFGPDFEVQLDADLTVRSRTLDGRTVPYESLSGGAREQLGLVARLACATLVAKEDGVPVLIDDALGFTDAGRLARMAEVFGEVGGDGQVIVLTCSPERYAGIGGAHRIALAG